MIRTGKKIWKREKNETQQTLFLSKQGLRLRQHTSQARKTPKILSKFTTRTPFFSAQIVSTRSQITCECWSTVTMTQNFDSLNWIKDISRFEHNWAETSTWVVDTRPLTPPPPPFLALASRGRSYSRSYLPVLRSEVLALLCCPSGSLSFSADSRRSASELNSHNLEPTITTASPSPSTSITRPSCPKAFRWWIRENKVKCHVTTKGVRLFSFWIWPN